VLSRFSVSTVPFISRAIPIPTIQSYSTRRVRMQPHRPSIGSTFLRFITGVLLVPLAIIMGILVRIGISVAGFALRKHIEKQFSTFSKQILANSKPIDQQIAILSNIPHHTDGYVTLLALMVLERHVLAYEALHRKAIETAAARKESGVEPSKNLTETIKDLYKRLSGQKNDVEFTIMVDLTNEMKAVEKEFDGSTTIQSEFTIFVVEGSPKDEGAFKFMIPFMITVTATKESPNEDFKLIHFLIRSEDGEVIFQMQDNFDEEIFTEDGQPRPKVIVVDAEVREK
jgi:hypothetical protein